MKFSTALAAPVLLAALGLAACDNYNQEQAKQPGASQSETGQQTGAVPPGAPSKAPPASGSSATPGAPPSELPPAEPQSR